MTKGFCGQCSTLVVALLTTVTPLYSQENAFVLGGTVELDDGQPAHNVEVWLRSESGEVSTRIEATDGSGRFEFAVRAPEAGSYKLLVYPYGKIYPSLAPKRQELAIRVPSKEVISVFRLSESVAEIRKKREKGEKLTTEESMTLRKYAEIEAAIANFLNGIDPADPKNAQLVNKLNGDFGEREAHRLFKRSVGRDE